ncbi:MFS general substrate transporter [Laetiporus sulphureus 93-53]|uniref:MFS general substrate transporter n=1 Tax=Laetiporus sulphureus 93-53 TaxID=1314785 RepID=A0A165BP52_9APHY|nr:MFS general substrate transporter [Laetiporus sulphureus 93-53]KZT01401.1 MFS general substrate transporter [Laetiporus sulphureus 93-53]
MSFQPSESLTVDAEKQELPPDASTNKSEQALSIPPADAEREEVSDLYEVILDLDQSPKHLSTPRKWTILLTISMGALCATFASSAAAFTEAGLARDLHTVHEVTILGVSLFVEGLGFGPLLVGPLSEVYGRNHIYCVSYFLFWVFTWPVAFPPNIATYLVFRFITGFCGSAFLSVAGGSVSDMFVNEKVATPMAVYTLSPFLGPVIGPLVSGFICQNVDWRWTYRVLLIWQFVVLLMLILLVPETYEPVLVKRKAARVRKETGDEKYWAPLDRRERSLFHAILFNCYTPFELLLYDRMALSLNVWTALLLGILYLAFQAFPIIFEDIHGFNYQETGLAFLGIGIGMVAALASQPLWNRYNRRMREKYDGNPPPETRLVIGQVGGILAPIGLFWLAFTTYRGVPWIVPIIASVPFGAGIYFIFTSVFTYLVIAYRPIAASAMASNSALRSAFAAAFPLFAGAMYDRLGAVGATALLAGLTTLMAPLPFIYYKIGARLREKSRFAAKP